MSFKLFIIPALVLSLLYGFAMATMAHAETVTVTVQLWNSECELVDDMVDWASTQIPKNADVALSRNS